MMQSLNKLKTDAETLATAFASNRLHTTIKDDNAALNKAIQNETAFTNAVNLQNTTALNALKPYKVKNDELTAKAAEGNRYLKSLLSQAERDAYHPIYRQLNMAATTAGDEYDYEKKAYDAWYKHKKQWIDVVFPSDRARYNQKIDATKRAIKNEDKNVASAMSVIWTQAQPMMKDSNSACVRDRSR